MNVVLFVLSYFLTVAGALNIAFPSSPPAQTTFTVAWSRDKNDPEVQFYLQKIKLDDPEGPTAKSTPVPIPDSQNNNGISPIFFNRAGLFEILAVNIQNGQTFYTTEVTVVTNPTSTGGPPTSVPTPTILASNNDGDDDGGGNGGGGGGGNGNGGNSNGGGNGGGGDDGNGKNGGGSQGSTTLSTGTTSQPTSSVNMGSTSGGSLTGTSQTSATKEQASSDSASPDSSDTKPTSSNSAVIIGSIVGVIGFLFVIAALLLCLRYRRRRQTSTFERAMMVRSPGSVFPWVTASGSPITEKDIESLSSASLGPQIRASDSLRAKATYRPPILTPPARSVISETTMSSLSSTSSARRARDRNTPRLSTSTYTTTTSESSSLRLFPLPALPPRTRTDRQMSIEEDIQSLQARMIYLQGRGDISPINRAEREEELRQINVKVARLKQLHESKWALGLTDERPPGLA